MGGWGGDPTHSVQENTHSTVMINMRSTTTADSRLISTSVLPSLAPNFILHLTDLMTVRRRAVEGKERLLTKHKAAVSTSKSTHGCLPTSTRVQERKSLKRYPPFPPPCCTVRSLISLRVRLLLPRAHFSPTTSQFKMTSKGPLKLICAQSMLSFTSLLTVAFETETESS